MYRLFLMLFLQRLLLEKGIKMEKTRGIRNKSNYKRCRKGKENSLGHALKRIVEALGISNICQGRLGILNNLYCLLR